MCYLTTIYTTVYILVYKELCIIYNRICLQYIKCNIHTHTYIYLQVYINDISTHNTIRIKIA